MLVYLAGPILGRSFAEATVWREAFTGELAGYGILTADPMRGKKYLTHEWRILDSYRQHAMSTDRGITSRDKFDVQRSDLLVVNFLGCDRVSIGTCIEYGWASAFGKPVFTVMERGDCHDHAMIRELSTFIVPSLEACIALLVQFCGTRTFEAA